METVREFASTNQIFIDRPKVKPASASVAGIGTDLQRAFNDLLQALSPAERTTITIDLSRRAGGPASGRQLDTSPAAVAQARALFSF